MKKKLSFLIVGANFANKGAQSMLFVTTNEIRKRFPEATVYFASSSRPDKTKYYFQFVNYCKDAKSIALDRNKYRIKITTFIKDGIRIVLGKKPRLQEICEFSKVIKEIDLIVDISGYILGSKWNNEAHEFYLDNLRIAKKFNIPIVLFPQSFGPFDYPPERQYLVDEMKELLPLAKVIFAREKEGYEALTKVLGLNNIMLSTDLVLQNSGIEYKDIIEGDLRFNLPKIKENSVAVIPNKQCVAHGKREDVLKTYSEIIRTINGQGKDVYILRHSIEDLEICKEIYTEFSTTPKIHLIENDFSCFEYDKLIKCFDFAVCSRYHGIVHAYRNGIPCILIGWAVKYLDLAEKMDQSLFAFDITCKTFNFAKMRESVILMCQTHEIQSSIIKQNVSDIQKDNCFEVMSELLK